MANVRVTDLEQLEPNLIGQYTWLLASHETDDHDERTSNKIGYPSLSSRMYDDFDMSNIKTLVYMATGDTSHALDEIENTIAQIQNNINVLANNVDSNTTELSKKEGALSAGVNIKNLKINGDTMSLVGPGSIDIQTGGGGQGPSEYIKSASVSQDSKILTLTKNDDTSINFLPPAGGAPEDYDLYKNKVDTNAANILNNTNKLALIKVKNVSVETAIRLASNLAVSQNAVQVFLLSELLIDISSTLYSISNAQCSDANVDVVSIYASTLANDNTQNAYNIVLHNKSDSLVTCAVIFNVQYLEISK